MTSEVDICNRAIQKVGAQAITSRSDDTAAARAVNRVFEDVRDEELRNQNWNFSIKRASLAASTTAPEWGYDKQFPLPADCIRLILVDGHYGVSETLGSYGTNEPDYRLEGRAILANDTGPLKIMYVSRVADPNEWDMQFRELIACRIAVEICEELTQSNTKKQLLMEEYERQLRRAVRGDGVETPGEALYESDWLRARI